MPVIVSSTTVIDNTRKLQNIAGANGVYDAFQPNIAQITSIIDFNTPMMELFMTGNVTFSESNKAAGKAGMLLLDTSSDQHTPSFSANIKWFNGTEPAWEDYQHWQIAFQCVDATVVRATAVGFTSLIPPASMATSFARPFGWDTQLSINDGRIGTFPEVITYVDFSHESANKRIRVRFVHGSSQSSNVINDVYINYTGLTNISSIQAQYNVSAQNCSGDCSPINYGVGPLPTNEGNNSGTYYDLPVAFYWMAQANPNEFASGQATTTASFDSANPDLRVKVVCDQGTFYSTCDIGGANEIFLRATKFGEVDR